MMLLKMTSLVQQLHKWNKEFIQLENDVNEFLLVRQIQSLALNDTHINLYQGLSIRMKELKRFQGRINTFLKTKCIYEEK